MSSSSVYYQHEAELNRSAPAPVDAGSGVLELRVMLAG